MNMNLYQSYKFMKEWAGGIVGQRALGALQLARAELWLDTQEDVRVEWQWDESGFDCLGDHEYWCSNARALETGYAKQHCDHAIECCLLVRKDDSRRGYEVLASLGGIIDPDRHYRRVVAADLALEVMEQLKIDNNAYLLEGIA